MGEDRVSVGEADQMMETAGQRVNVFVGNLINSWIAETHDDEKLAEHFLGHMTRVLGPLDQLELCAMIYELSRRLAFGMVEAVGGDINNLKQAMEEGHVLGMTTNKELAYRDLPSL